MVGHYDSVGVASDSVCDIVNVDVAAVDTLGHGVPCEHEIVALACECGFGRHRGVGADKCRCLYERTAACFGRHADRKLVVTGLSKCYRSLDRSSE